MIPMLVSPASRWPYEIQVLRTRVKHIPNTPEEGEQLYKLTGLEKVYHIRGLEGITKYKYRRYYGVLQVLQV